MEKLELLYTILDCFMFQTKDGAIPMAGRLDITIGYSDATVLFKNRGE